jgi:RNA polymerase sigma-70 factor, ECF subfamily
MGQTSNEALLAPPTGSHEITHLLLAWNKGDNTVLDRLVPLVHAELRRLARHYMRRERAGHTLQTTALINEAYLKLIDDGPRVSWQNRAHFFGIAARLMRRILVDFARERNFQKRDGGRQVSLDAGMIISPSQNTDVVALDEALSALTAIDERKARVVELRHFGGLTEKEIATVLEVSGETVRRDWRLAKSWLLRRLTEGH